MRNTLLVGALASVFFACGASPEQLCKDAVNIQCDKFFECATDEQKELLKAAYGETAAECKTKLVETAKCAERKDTATACPDGQTYDAAAASKCVSDYSALTCDDLNAGTTPDSCDNICK